MVEHLSRTGSQIYLLLASVFRERAPYGRLWVSWFGGSGCERLRLTRGLPGKILQGHRE